eukprot:3029115-Alexandrium_andersonii.AAC.1
MPLERFGEELAEGSNEVFSRFLNSALFEGVAEPVMGPLDSLPAPEAIGFAPDALQLPGKNDSPPERGFWALRLPIWSLP